MNWLDRDLQNELLQYFAKQYPNPKNTEFDYCIWLAEKTASSQMQLQESNLNAEIQADKNGIIDFTEVDEAVDKLRANIAYLKEHNLLDSSNNLETKSNIKITAKGIDFLANDGGLSAILGVVTIKLHQDTIRELIAAKIDNADISELEKSELKSILNNIKETAINKLTEKAIENIPFASLANILSALG